MSQLIKYAWDTSDAVLLDRFSDDDYPIRLYDSLDECKRDSVWYNAGRQPIKHFKVTITVEQEK